MANKKEPNIGGLVSLDDVTFSYPRLHEPDENEKYSVHCSGLTDAQRDELIGIGANPKNGEDRIDMNGNPKPTPEWGWYITPRTKFEFTVCDKDGVEVRGEEKQALLEEVGDGSTGSVEVKTGAYVASGKKGVSLFLQAVQIGKLVTKKAGHSFAPIEGGTYESGKERAEAEAPF